MIVKITTEITLQDILNRRATYDGTSWYGDPELVRLLSGISQDEVRGYKYDPILQYGEYICKTFHRITISDTKTVSHEYPDNTVF